jgi:hypothetical protein
VSGQLPARAPTRWIVEVTAEQDLSDRSGAGVEPALADALLHSGVTSCRSQNTRCQAGKPPFRTGGSVAIPRRRRPLDHTAAAVHDLTARWERSQGVPEVPVRVGDRAGGRRTPRRAGQGARP